MFRLIRRLNFKRSKKVYYTPITDSVSLNISIIQAATMLDEAGMKAISNGNVDQMIAVAAGWMEFGSNMLANPEDEESDGHEEEEEVLSDTSVMGFRSDESREVLESEKCKSRRQAGIQDQHGRLRNP